MIINVLKAKKKYTYLPVSLGICYERFVAIIVTIFSVCSPLSCHNSCISHVVPAIRSIIKHNSTKSFEKEKKQHCTITHLTRGHGVMIDGFNPIAAFICTFSCSFLEICIHIITWHCFRNECISIP